MDYYITNVRKDEQGVIYYVRMYQLNNNSLSFFNDVLVPEVYDMINKGYIIYTALTVNNEYKKGSKVLQFSEYPGHKHIKTIPDKYKQNNLDNLPKF